MLDKRFEERMRSLLGDSGFEEYLSELGRKSPRAFRVNSLKSDIDPSRYFEGVERVPYCDTAYYFDDERVGGHPLHHAGAIYVQEAGAMVPVASVDILPDFKILDTCAAPGGKSLQAAACLGDGGFILSNEINPQRMRVLSGNFERMGVKNSLVTSAEVSDIADLYESYFDLVIVDAPCSGEGMFRKEPDALKNWSEDYVMVCAERQKKILSSASRAVRGGGVLLYSTCTFSTEENENIVNGFISENEDFELISPKDSILDYTLSGVGDSRMRRFYPHIAKGEGQFCAVMKRRGEEFSSPSFKSALTELTAEERSITLEFLNDTLVDFDPANLKKFKDNVVYISPRIPVAPRITYSCGVTLGEVRRGYFQPHHQLFSAMGPLFKRKIDLPLKDPRLTSYLKGESFSFDIENGWAVILAESVCLGGGKAVNGTVKNHYPKGLRDQTR